MVPTLVGRIQTRLFMLATVGALLTALVTPLLPLMESTSHPYRMTFSVLLAVAVFGVGWEVVYHGLQQFRWEKDWPILLGLVTAVNEGALVYFLARTSAVPFLPAVPLTPFLIQFLVVWIGVWIVVNGPMRVPFLHWRFRGGRVL